MGPMEKTISLYVDVPFGWRGVEVDDFIVTIGKKGHTNSVYHISESKKRYRGRTVRYYVKCFKSDLMTCCKRDKAKQKVIDIVWYPRNKKNEEV